MKVFAKLTIVLLIISGYSCIKRNNKDDASKIKSLVDKAAVLSVNGNYLAPIHYLDSSLSGKKLNLREKIEVYGFKADIFNNQLHNYPKAIAYTDSMLNLVEAIGPVKYKTEFAIANYAKGDVLFNLKQYNEAYTYYYKARAIGKTNLDSCTLGEYSFRLALVLYRQSRFYEAAINFERSFKESGSCPLDFGKYYRLQQVLNNIGLSYYKAGMYDSALFYYQNALNFIKEKGNSYPERKNLNDVANAVVYGNMADIYWKKGDTSLAKQLLRQSIDINIKKGNDNRDAQYSMIKLADIFSEQKQPDSGLIILSNLKAGLDTIKNTRAEMDWNRLMWQYWKDKNDITTAYKHLMTFTALRDTLEKESNQLKAVDLSQQIRMMESQFEIQSLQKNNEVKNIYLWVAVIASVLAIIILFYIFRNLIRTQKNVALLESLNDTVNQQKIELEKALLTVEDKNRQQERILRAVAHDLRAPIATIAMLGELLEQEQDVESRKEMIGFIRASCSNSLELIAEILEAADLSNRKEQAKETVNLNLLVKNTSELLKIKASEKQQSINCDLPKEEFYMLLNPEKIKRVINNLITNAIKFSGKDSEILVSLKTDNDGALIIVKDHGIGIPLELQSKVFDMFTDAKRKGTNGELPYGLGLSICKQIVEAHNGNIWFTTEVGKGTSFFVRLYY